MAAFKSNKTLLSPTHLTQRDVQYRSGEPTVGINYEVLKFYLLKQVEIPFIYLATVSVRKMFYVINS